jgi:hypothetical protein
MEFSEFACVIFISVFWILVTVKEVKEHRRQAPNGKVFVREFVDKVKTIESATKHLDKPSIIEKDNFKFEVTVKEDEHLKGLKYETIPVHTSKCVYINDEPVCRIHRIDVSTKAKYYLDFTCERHLNEIIDIIESSYKACKSYEDTRWKNLLDPSNKSFYTIIK